MVFGDSPAEVTAWNLGQLVFKAAAQASLVSELLQDHLRNPRLWLATKDL